MPGQVAKRLSDGPVTIPRGVLVDERGPCTGMPKPDHQLLETCAARGGEGAARVPEIVEMQVRDPCPRTRLDPYPPEVGPPERRSLWADEDESPLPRLGETLQVPANLGHELGREGHSTAARV